MAYKKTGKPVGRPKYQFTEEQLKIADDAAFQGCKNNTIAGLIGVPQETLEKYLLKRLRQKRQERDRELRRAQTKMAAHNVAMAIFLGKNELEQSDRQDWSLTGKDGQQLLPLLVEVKDVPLDKDDSK